MDLKNLYGGNVLVSSPGMHSMAKIIVSLLNKQNNDFSHIKADYTNFANGEIKPKIPETVRGTHVFLLYALQEPDPNNAIISMLLTNDALTRASVTGITLVLPYIPYLRQDRKDEPRVPISARLIADMIEVNRSVQRVITLDMHTDQEQGFFSIPVDNINAMKVHAEYFSEKFKDDFSQLHVIAPDFGSAIRARRFANQLGSEVPISIIEKRRTGPNQTVVQGLIGPKPEDKIAIIYDDMIDTGNTTLNSIDFIYEEGAKAVYACATHGIFSENAEVNFRKTGRPVIVTNSVPRTTVYKEKNSAWLNIVSIEELLAKTIREASIVGGSMSKL